MEDEEDAAAWRRRARGGRWRNAAERAAVSQT